MDSKKEREREEKRRKGLKSAFIPSRANCW